MESSKNIKSLETKFLDRIEILEGKLSELQNKMLVETKTVEISNKEISKEAIISNEERNKDSILVKTDFNCDICSKQFKSISNILNHDKKFHMQKGTNLYKCDNCNEKLEDKTIYNYIISQRSIKHEIYV